MSASETTVQVLQEEKGQLQHDVQEMKKQLHDKVTPLIKIKSIYDISGTQTCNYICISNLNIALQNNYVPFHLFIQKVLEEKLQAEVHKYIYVLIIIITI